MDGYHLSRAQLCALPNAAEALARRGAEFTFDGASFLSFVRAVRAQGPNSPTIYAPSFDHKLKDPKPNDIQVLASTKVVLFEGNYLSLDRAPWKEAAELMDELWYVDVEFETAKRRLVERHIRAGITLNREAAAKRVEENDLPNGKEIVRHRIKEVDEVIVSRDDDTWKPEACGK
jgi:pantothenate kinase